MGLSSLRSSVFIAAAPALILLWLGPNAWAAESVYVSQPVCQAFWGGLRASDNKLLTETKIYFNVYDNGLGWANGQVATNGPYKNTCQLLVARDGTANSPGDVWTSVYHAWTSAKIPALYLSGEGRASPAANSPSWDAYKSMTADIAFANGFAIRNALLLTAIRKKRVDARAAGCDTLIIHAIGFSRGSEALAASYHDGKAAYGDRQSAAKAVLGYVTLIDPVNSVAWPSDSSTVIFDNDSQPAAQTDDSGTYRRLQPLLLTTVIKQQEFRRYFQPHVHNVAGSTELRYNESNLLGLTDGTPSPPTTLAQLRAAGPSRRNSYLIAYINGMHSAWWRENQLSQFALAEADFAFLLLCQEGIVDCLDFKMNFHDYYASPSGEGDGNILGGTAQRDTPRRWTLLHRTVRAPASMNILALQTAPCLGLPCTGVNPADFTYTQSDSYNSWRWQSANVVPSEQAAWMARPNLGLAENEINDTAANAQTHFGNTRAAFLGYFDDSMRVCRQVCIPTNLGVHYYQPLGVRYYTLIQKSPCSTLTTANAATASAGCRAVNPGYTGTADFMDASGHGAFTGSW